jgi:rhamnose transport system permease protein
MKRYWHEMILGGLLVALLVAAGMSDNGFIKPATQLELSTHVWDLALLALPMTLIIVTAGIDLSAGSTMALCAVVLGLTYEARVPIWWCAALAILTGLAAGALNGVFVAKVRVHPLIVTLATLSTYRGIAEGISLGRPISGFPDNFVWIGQGSVGGLPIPGVIFTVAVIVFGVLLARSVTGRALYAMGHNETASRYSGLPVEKIKLLIYSLSGAMAGLAAVLFVARRNTAKADIGTGMELDVITAVVLGGTSIFGGRGRIVGTLLGVLLIHETREFVSWRWNNDELILVVVGVLLIAAVLINSAVTRRRPND